MRPADRTFTVAELIEFLRRCDPEREVVGKVAGGIVDILWSTDDETDDDGEPVVMLGLDS